MPTSRATRVTSPAKALSWSTIVLMVSFSSRISPRTSTVIFFDKSPLAIAVETSAMLRTCAVRFDAMEFTESVKSFQVPATPSTLAWPPRRPSVPTSRATRVTSPAKALSWSTIVLMVSFSCRISPETLTVIFFDKSPPAMAVATSAMLRTCAVRLPAMKLTLSVRSFQVPATPGTCRLAAELAFGADLARDARDFRGERVELVHHRVDGVFELENFAAHVDRDLARQVAARDRRGHMRDVAHLVGEVAAHGVHRVGQVLPGAGDARHDGLAAELAVGADLARHARDFRGERTQLIDHRIDGFLELQDFAAHVDRDLFRQVAVRHRDRHFGDVADLRGQVRRHRVDALGEILPHAGHAADLRLAAELAFGADLARDARHLRGEHVELLDHGVDDFGGAQEFAFQRPAVDVERHGAQQIALRHRGDGARDFGRRPQQIVDQRIDARLHLAPGAVGKTEADALAGAALAPDHLADPLELLGHSLIGGDDIIEGVGDLADDADAVAGHAHGKIADLHRLQRVEEFGQPAGIGAGVVVGVILGSLVCGRYGSIGGGGANNGFSGSH